MGKYRNYLYYLILVIPVVIFYYLFFKYTVNAPINDDYQAILDSVNKIISTDSASEKIKIFFSQHNEHRIVYDRIWSIISYKLHTHIDFNFLAFIGNLSLLGMGIVFWKRFTMLQKPIILFLPIVIFLFNITSWENMTFPMAALSNFTVYLFILISLAFITSDTSGNKKNILLAFLFLFFAAITQGGGLFLIPISIVVLLYKKEYKNVAIYGAMCAVLVAVYFYNFQKPPQNAGALESILEFKHNVVLFAFAFLGNAFNYYLVYNNPIYSVHFTMVVGALFFALFLYITFTKYYKKNLFVYSLMLLLVMSAFITAVSRISFGVETAGASRYRINGIIFLITLYLWFVDTREVKKPRYLYPILAVSIVYYFYINLRQTMYLSIREKQTYAGILQYNYGNPEALNGEKSMINLYKTIIEQSRTLDTYIFPDNKQLEHYYPFAETTIINKGESGDSSSSLNNNTETVTKLPDCYMIEGWAFLEGHKTKNQKVYIGIKNEKDEQPIYYLANQTTRFDLSPYFNKPYLDDGGYLLRINESLVKTGESKIWVMVVNEDQTKIQETDKKITK